MSIFYDTNIFVYAVSHSTEDAEKRAIAVELIARGEFSLSVQVIQEFINTCLSKARLGQSPDAIASTAEFLFGFPCAMASQSAVVRALTLQRRYQIKYWDAAILSSALEMGCHTLFSEDLNHGQDYNGIRVLNPFRGIGSV